MDHALGALNLRGGCLQPHLCLSNQAQDMLRYQLPLRSPDEHACLGKVGYQQHQVSLGLYG